MGVIGGVLNGLGRAGGAALLTVAWLAFGFTPVAAQTLGSDLRPLEAAPLGPQPSYGPTPPLTYTLPPLIARSAEHRRLVDPDRGGAASVAEVEGVVRALTIAAQSALGRGDRVGAVAHAYELQRLLSAPAVAALRGGDRATAERAQRLKTAIAAAAWEVAARAGASPEVAPAIAGMDHRAGAAEPWRLQLRAAALEALRARHGDALWQYALWRQMLPGVYASRGDPQAEQLYAVFAAAAGRMGSPIAAFEAAHDGAIVIGDPDRSSSAILEAGLAFAPHLLSILRDKSEPDRRRFASLGRTTAVVSTYHALADARRYDQLEALRSAALFWVPRDASLETDFIVSMYGFDLAIPLFYEDPARFDRFAYLWSKRSGCDREWGASETVVHSLCVLDIAVRGYDASGRPGVAAAYAEGAVAAYGRYDAHRHRLPGALLALADVRWNLGEVQAAAEAIDRVARLAAEDATLDPNAQVQFLEQSARIEDARLDDRGVAAALDALHGWADAAEGSWEGVRARAEDSLLELADDWLSGAFCARCSDQVSRGFDLWLDRMAGRVVEAAGAETEDDRAFFRVQVSLTALRAGKRLRDQSAAVDRLWRTEIVDEDIWDSRTDRVLSFYDRMRPRLGDRYTVERANELWLLSRSLPSEPGAFAEEEALAFLLERDLAEKRRRGAEVIRAGLDHLGQFTAEGQFYRGAARAAAVLEDRGFTMAAQVVAESALSVELKEARAQADLPADYLRQFVRELAPVFIDLAARAGRLQAWRGEHERARRNVDFALELLDEIRAEEWRAANTDAAASMQSLNASIRSVADAAHRILERGGGVGAVGEADAARAVRALQLATANDTALFAVAALQRRASGSDAAYAAFQTRGRLISERDRLVRLMDGGLLREAASIRARVAAIDAEITAAEAASDRALERYDQVAAAETVPLAEARAELAPDEGLLVLHAGEEELLGLLVGREGPVRAWRSPLSRAALEAAHLELRAGLDLTDGFPDFPLRRAAELYAEMFGPVGDAALAAYPKLTIVADGPLQGFPFATLPVQPVLNAAGAPVETFGPDNLNVAAPWMGVGHALVYAPSLRNLVSLRRDAPKSAADRPFLGVGDPVFAGAPGLLKSGALRSSGALESAAGRIDLAALRALPALPETSREVREVAEILGAGPTDLLLREAANERAVKIRDLSQYRVIAFSTHGFAAGDAGLDVEPGLALTPPETATPENDGFLALSEILALRLDAELVMLSACSTATSDGRPRAGAMSGLARSFFAAGARRVFASLWVIPDVETRQIVTHMVRSREEGLAEDWRGAFHDALVSAAVLNRFTPEARHPAVWGAFVMMGG